METLGHSILNSFIFDANLCDAQENTLLNSSRMLYNNKYMRNTAYKRKPKYCLYDNEIC